MNSKVDVVCKLFVFICFVFRGAALTPYVQVSIFNLPHPYLKSTTVLLDILMGYKIVRRGIRVKDDQVVVSC